MIKPYKNLEGSKKEQVRTMFNRIAPRYDLLNHLLSFGIDNIWRKNVVKQLRELKAPIILDVATGTGDLAIQIAGIDPVAVYALDLSEEMLAIAREKIEKRRLHMTIQLKHGDSEELPFENNFFDAATVAFGVRNFENLQKGLSEIHRVLRQGGRLVVLEFSRPKMFPLKQLYHFYITRILPWWGGIISHDKDAYSYLPESALQFPDGKDFTDELQKAGFECQKTLQQTFGVATIYVATKK
ncbi:bifunctional demethylmenaquinone methyltransferase/2-methoxy-6-polyprenyl-1,4-benzoquinol methylase UbiE [Anaerophaga thermohalophila]|jgi:demethylmenaquinone methyltransferase/2-methoxy-6-polyprenyl-1,4-benzoquinol methylase|uniref:bifunctional demethylmenaquinone methyltransferase/2-methoxy-6-polyprenyl-1,4-benzoquinol methylase UbiE n=1 Tax=Anaerophaga thermohalophila TaxID=177400 RepID=UPI00031F2134|nr:bifunctional demethylmenaquinone methyltransferase/2-methoxy-6-polyprenyl-1,4-benzoquinol methylase UbiE [Anaerophaga thermohalophila]